MNEIIKIGNKTISVIEWNGVRVVTTAQLAEIYEASETKIKQNYGNNEGRFKEGEHFYLLKGTELKEFKNQVENFYPVDKHSSSLYLWTRRGASRHCKMLGTDKAWEQFDILEENYYNPPKASIPQGKELLALAVIEAQRTIEEQSKRIEEMKPKAEFFDAVADSKDAIEIGKVAKVLNYPGIGRNKLFEILRQNGILMRNNIPYQKYIDNGCFRTIEQKYSMPDGETRISIKTLVYQKGVDHIRRVLKS